MEAKLIPEMTLGKFSDFISHQGKKISEDVRSAIAHYEKAQNILDVADAYTVLPESNMFSMLKDSIKHAGDGVSETFFGEETESAVWGGVNCTGDRDELAVALMSVSLTKVGKYDFNKTTYGTKAKQHYQSLINSGKGAKMGRALLVEDLVRHHGLQKFLDHKDKWVRFLESILSNKVYIIGTAVKQLVSENNLPAKMKLFFLKLFGSKKFDDIVKAWIEHSSDKLVKPAVEFAESANHLKFCIGDLEADPFTGTVTAVSEKPKTQSWDHTTMPPILMGPMMPVTTSHTDVTFGGPVRDWLDSANGPKKFGLRTGKEPNNIQKHSHPKSPLGCFLGDTEVLLENGSSVPIDSLAEHMTVVGAKGHIGSISSEKVEIEFKQETLLYGFNKESPFFLANHPFWTQHGWRAVDPNGAKEENDWLEIGQLSEGDHVYRVTGYDEKHHKVEYDWVEIETIPHTMFAAGTMVYGVHLREGPRSYHANGYLVACNYPEITAERMKEGMQKLSFADQKKLHEHLKAMKPQLEKMLPPGVAEALATVGEKHLEHVLNPKDPAQSKKHGLEKVIIPSMELKHNSGTKPFHGQRFPTHVSLVRGQLFLDGHKEPVESHIIDENKISWTRRYRRRWEHGTLQLYPDRHLGHGVVSLTRTRDDKRSLHSSTFVAAANKNTYTCYISKNPISSDNDPASEWNSFGKLVSGLDCTGGTCHRIGEIQIPPDMDEPDSLENHVLFSVNSDMKLLVTVQVPNEYKSFLGYTKLTGTFNWDYSGFRGVAIKYDATKPGFEGDHYAWKGDIIKNLKTDAMLAATRKTAMEDSVHKLPDHLFATPLTHLTKQTTRKYSSIASMAMTTALKTDSHLSLEHLFTLAPPDPQSVHDLTFSLIQKCMKYKMNDSDRENILGVVKPNDLPGNLVAVADKYSGFFKDRFANAYLMNGLAKNEHFKDKISQNEQDQLLYYWAGNVDSCLSGDKDYTKVNNEVVVVAYLQSLPELQRYVDEGGPAWAQKLFDHLTSPQVLTGLALSENIAQSTALIQKQSMVLNCLDPGSDHGEAFFKQVMMTRLNENSSYFQGNSTDEDRMTDFIGDYIRQLVVQILSGGDVITAEISGQLNKELEDCARELNIEMSADAEVTAHAVITSIGDFISETMTIFNMTRGPMWDKLTKSVNKWMADHPKLTFTGKFLSSTITMSAWGMSLFFTVQTFLDWKDLKPEEKASAVANTVAFTFTSISKIPDFLKGVQASCRTGRSTFGQLADWIKARRNPNMVRAVEIEMQDFANTSGASVEGVIGEVAAEAGADAAQTLSNWTRFFAITEAIAQVTTVIALGFAAVAIGFQIARDFKNNASDVQKGLDIMQGICIGIAFFAAAAGLFISSIAIPIIGIACAVVGLVLALVDIFMHREKPKPKPTPADLYVSGTGKTFIATITAPPQEWLDNYHTDHADDDK